MANAIYPNYKDAILTAGSNTSLNQDTVNDGPYCELVDTGTYSYTATHEFVNPDLSGTVGTGQRITTPTVGTVADGVFDGDNLTFTSVSGNSVEALVIYRNNAGADTTHRLVAYIDTGVTGLPVTPNGGDITVTWNASGIFLISDERLKENIKLVGDLHGVFGVYEFNYLGHKDVHTGLLAQEVEEVLPHAVIDRGDGYKIVDYSAAKAGALNLAEMR